MLYPLSYGGSTAAVPTRGYGEEGIGRRRARSGAGAAGRTTVGA